MLKKSILSKNPVTHFTLKISTNQRIGTYAGLYAMKGDLNVIPRGGSIVNPLASGSQSILFQKFKGFFSFLVPKNHKIFYA